MKLGVYKYKKRLVYVFNYEEMSNGRTCNFAQFFYIEEDGSLGELGGDYKFPKTFMPTKGYKLYALKTRRAMRI